MSSLLDLVLLADVIFIALVILSIYMKAMRSEEREYLASMFANFRMKQKAGA